MKKQYNDRSIYDNDLKQLDKEIMSNRKRKNQTRSNLLWKIDSKKQPSKKLGGLKYATSLGVFMVLIFMGYQLFADGMSSSNEQASTAPQDNQTGNFLVLDDADESTEQELISGSNNGDRTESIEENKDESKAEKNDEAENTSEEVTDELATYKPSKQEIAELDIPIHTNYSSNADAKPEITIYDREEGKIAVVVIPMDEEPITISEWTYGSEHTVDDMVKEAASWHKHYDVEITEFKGHPMVVSNKGDGYFEIHIVTPEKLFSIGGGGAEKDILLSIAEEINL